MEHAKIKGHLELATNIAVLLVALAVLSLFAANYFQRPPAPQAGLHNGTRIAQLPPLDYRSATQTMLIVMSVTCNYCQESTPFYRRLIEAAQQRSKELRLVMVFPNPAAEVKTYMEQQHLSAEAVSGADLKALKVTATPTIILVDSSGSVADFWIGKLSSEGERQVLRAISAET